MGPTTALHVPCPRLLLLLRPGRREVEDGHQPRPPEQGQALGLLGRAGPEPALGQIECLGHALSDLEFFRGWWAAHTHTLHHARVPDGEGSIGAADPDLVVRQVHPVARLARVLRVVRNDAVGGPLHRQHAPHGGVFEQGGELAQGGPPLLEAEGRLEDGLPRAGGQLHGPADEVGGRLCVGGVN